MGEVYRALSDPTRRQILALLRERDHGAGELADRLAIPKPTLSGHLTILKSADLVDVTRQGTRLTYRVNLSVLEAAVADLIDLFQLRAPGRERVPRARKI